VSTARAADTAAVSSQSALPPGVWAIVDSHTITKDEVEQDAKRLPPLLSREQALAAVLSKKVNEIVVASGLDRDGVGPSSVSSAEIDAFIDEQRAQLKRMRPDGDFDAELKKAGIPLEEVRATVRLRLAFDKRVQRDATEEALRAWFHDHLLELAGEVRATQVLIAPRGDDTQTFQRAVAILAKVKADGSNMAQLAREHSDDPNAPLDSGDTDFFTEGATTRALPPEVIEACFALGKRGLVPRPISSTRGYHVVFVTDTRIPSEPVFERERERVRQRFIFERQKELYTTWKAAAHIEVAPDAPRITDR
jgi:parvulin-like peptidyl-prolyl isomerase